MKRRYKVLLSATAITTAAAAIGLGSAASWSDSEVTEEQVETGSFSLRLDGEVVQDASVPVVNFAPGDSVTRTLDVTNDGEVDYAGVTMQLRSDLSSSALLDGTSKGLQVEVRHCDVPWTRELPSSDVVEVTEVHGYYCLADQSYGNGAYAPYWAGGYQYVGPGNGSYDYDGEGFFFVGWTDRVVDGGLSVVRSGPFSTEPVDVPDSALRAGGSDVYVNSSSVSASSYEPQSDSTAHLLVTISLPATVGDDQDVDDLDSDYARYGNQTATVEYGFTAVQRSGNETEQQTWSDRQHREVEDANLSQQLPG